MKIQGIQNTKKYDDDHIMTMQVREKTTEEREAEEAAAEAEDEAQVDFIFILIS